MKKASPVSRMNNAQVRVTEWQFEPGAATGFHRHEFDYVVVPLVDGLLRLVSPGVETSAALRTGVAYFRKAGVEHDVINAGDKPLASSRSNFALSSRSVAVSPIEWYMDIIEQHEDVWSRTRRSTATRSTKCGPYCRSQSAEAWWRRRFRRLRTLRHRP